MAPKALLRVEGGLGREIVLVRRRRKAGGGDEGEMMDGFWQVASQSWTIAGLKTACVIGVNPHERLEKQSVVLELGVSSNRGDDDGDSLMIGEEGHEMWRRMVRRVLEIVEASEFLTVEALVGMVAGVVVAEFPVPRIRVRCEKPSALAFVEGAGVEIVREREREREGG